MPQYTIVLNLFDSLHICDIVCSTENEIFNRGPTSAQTGIFEDNFSRPPGILTNAQTVPFSAGSLAPRYQC